MKLPQRECTGCAACNNICPRQAIQMVENFEGFLYPEINKKLCVDCHLCEKTCPVLNASEFFPEVSEVYAVWNKNDDIRIKSSSGGIFDVIAKYILDHKGIVIGAAWGNNIYEVNHVAINTYEQLHKIRKSKYVQSNIGNIYKEVKDYLIDNRMVLFSGTPCQVAGLKAFLGHTSDKDNLYTLEVLCHGVPSYAVLKEYISAVEKIHNQIITRIECRYKDNSNLWKDSVIGLHCKDGTIISDKNDAESIFWTGYLGNLFLRESCYSCPYATPKRTADITLGDFWGIWNEEDYKDIYEKGVSLVQLNSEQGRNLFLNIKDKIVDNIASKENAYNNNPILTKSPERSPKREYFFDHFRTVRFDKLIKKCFRKKYISISIRKKLGKNI